MTSPERVMCTHCGTTRDVAADPTAALTWVAERESAVVRWLCPRCVREHVRDIEGKLPREYW